MKQLIARSNMKHGQVLILSKFRNTFDCASGTENQKTVLGLILFLSRWLNMYKRWAEVENFRINMFSLTISTTERNKPLISFHGFNYTIDRSTDKKRTGSVSIRERSSAKHEYRPMHK
jgi:hypothetical protein